MKNQNVKKTKLEFMDVEECKKVLKAAGVDPRKYDF